MGTHVLLESAKVAKISRFIHVSTDEVYGEQTMDQEAMSEEQVTTTVSVSVSSRCLAKSRIRILLY